MHVDYCQISIQARFTTPSNSGGAKGGSGQEEMPLSHLRLAPSPLTPPFGFHGKIWINFL